MSRNLFNSRTLVCAALAILPAFAANDKTYLALGDSVPFGLDLTKFTPSGPLPTADQFKGYPEVVADVERLTQSKKLVNASCPGETSSSFLVIGPDNGCNTAQGGGPVGSGFKFTIGLRAPYKTSQMEFALAQLSANKRINLVTLSLGGNELLLVESLCATSDPQHPDPACVRTELQKVLPLYIGNMIQVLARIRSVYSGTLILVKYFAPSADPLFIEAITALNSAMVVAATGVSPGGVIGPNFGVKFADGFMAFRLASAFFGGDPCKAGLLIKLSPTVCDVHPSPLGRDVLASSVLLTLLTNR